MHFKLGMNLTTLIIVAVVAWVVYGSFQGGVAAAKSSTSNVNNGYAAQKTGPIYGN